MRLQGICRRLLLKRKRLLLHQGLCRVFNLTSNSKVKNNGDDANGGNKGNDFENGESHDR